MTYMPGQRVENKKSPKRSHGHNNTPILPQGFPWDSPKKLWVLKGHQYHQLLSSKVEKFLIKFQVVNGLQRWTPIIFRFVTSPNNMSEIYPSQPTQKIHKNSEEHTRTHTHTLNNATQEDNPTQLYLKESDKSNYPNYPEKSSRGPRADDSRAKWWKGAILPGFGGLANLKGKQPTFFGNLKGWGGVLRC